MMGSRAASLLDSLSDDQVGLASGAMHAVCADSPTADSFQELQEVAPDRRRHEESMLVTAHPEVWQDFCGPEGLRMLSVMEELPIGDRRDHLWRTCPLAAGKWMSRTEFLEADGLLIAPFVAASVLEDGGIHPEDARALVRGLAGLPAADLKKMRRN